MKIKLHEKYIPDKPFDFKPKLRVCGITCSQSKVAFEILIAISNLLGITV